MKKKLAAIVLTCVLAMSTLAGCGTNGQENKGESVSSETTKETKEDSGKKETVTLTDNVGRKVELECPVDSAASVLRYNNELIRACGAIDKIVSVDLNTAQDREYWGMFDPDNVIGKSQRELDYEKIVELNPEVVIIPDNGAYEEAEEKLEPFGIKVFVISGYDTADFKNQVENIGKMFGVEEKAQEFYDYFNGKLEYIKKQLDGVEKRSLYFESTSPLTTVLAGDPMYDMIEYAEAENIFAVDNENISASEVDPEEVIARNPDVIVKLVTPAEALAGTGLYEPPTKDEFKAAYEDITGRAGWDGITAVKNDDIYFMTQFSHGGAGKLVGTCYIAKMLYPDLLPDLDPDEIFRAWMEDFQGFKDVDGHFYSGKDLH
ncbi:ferrichrome/ferrioxamine B periplasmic transporter [uncultured Roseburia sp.]|uniref:ABC transporter substrate-binding protein n=1 Tax=Brotonthovivens ammoniilytica TaxID=2981725 RepID=A0ABT2THP5_9FIRM|nr:ABC transporter substrate-binding protein [Brotonthovivens ammoniilytica]MCU6761718.1 ABC transporter substrate-binding protein [Brotonthovivens ammoniilytica]SCI44432.1 ferrichrome/ferrioxamine B periplasmic transporter [uncultured Roseburia sp.]